MSEQFRKYLLLSTALRAPAGEAGAGDPPDDPQDDRIPAPTVDDDETPTDPENETGDEDPDAQDDPDREGADIGDGEPADEPERRSRGDRAIGALRAERRRLAEENARITRQLDELRRAPPAPAQPQETSAQRAERLALMSPEERTQYLVDESLQRHQQQTDQVMAQLMDQADRTSFETRAAANPLLKKFAPQVESTYAQLRAQGRPVDRNTVAAYLIGQKVLEQQGRAKPAAQRRARQQQARPANGAGDIPSNRRERSRGPVDTAADMEARFGDVLI